MHLFIPGKEPFRYASHFERRSWQEGGRNKLELKTDKHFIYMAERTKI